MSTDTPPMTIEEIRVQILKLEDLVQDMAWRRGYLKGFQDAM